MQRAKYLHLQLWHAEKAKKYAHLLTNQKDEAGAVTDIPRGVIPTWRCPCCRKGLVVSSTSKQGVNARLFHVAKAHPDEPAHKFQLGRGKCPRNQRKAHIAQANSFTTRAIARLKRGYFGSHRALRLVRTPCMGKANEARIKYICDACGIVSVNSPDFRNMPCVSGDRHWKKRRTARQTLIQTWQGHMKKAKDATLRADIARYIGELQWREWAGDEAASDAATEPSDGRDTEEP